MQTNIFTFYCTARESTEGTFIPRLHPVELHPNRDILKIIFLSDCRALKVKSFTGFWESVLTCKHKVTLGQRYDSPVILGHLFSPLNSLFVSNTALTLTDLWTSFVHENQTRRNIKWLFGRKRWDMGEIFWQICVSRII